MAFPIPYSYRTYDGSGTTISLVVPFPFILREHVRVYINWDIRTDTQDATLIPGDNFTWINDGLITTTIPVAFGDTVSVVRVTPINIPVVEWLAGSPPTATELSASDQQVFYAVQEFIDRVVTTQGSLNIITDSGLIPAIDNLFSTSSAAALAANQGRVLKELIDALVPEDGGSAIFTAAGAGAVTRTFTSKLRDVVSVRDFGAVGNGVTDDSAAIQAAVDSLTNGGEVFFPAADYRIGASITSSGKDLHWNASGARFFVAKDIPLFILYGGWENIQQVTTVTSTTIQVPDASVYEAEDVLKIRGPQRLPINASNGFMGEFVVVDQVDLATNTITVASPMLWDYTASWTTPVPASAGWQNYVSVAKISDAKIRVDIMEATGDPDNDGGGERELMWIEACKNAEIYIQAVPYAYSGVGSACSCYGGRWEIGSIDFAGVYGLPRGSSSLYASGTLANRSTFDTRGAGYVYHATDDGNLYFRETATPGVWSAPVPYPDRPTTTRMVEDARGLFAARTAHDAKPSGFVYYATDTLRLYIRVGAAGGWSPPVPYDDRQVGGYGLTPKNTEHMTFRIVNSRRGRHVYDGLGNASGFLEHSRCGAAAFNTFEACNSFNSVGCTYAQHDGTYRSRFYNCWDVAGEEGIMSFRGQGHRFYGGGGINTRGTLFGTLVSSGAPLGDTDDNEVIGAVVRGASDQIASSSGLASGLLTLTDCDIEITTLPSPTTSLFACAGRGIRIRGGSYKLTGGTLSTCVLSASTATQADIISIEGADFDFTGAALASVRFILNQSGGATIAPNAVIIMRDVDIITGANTLVNLINDTAELPSAPMYLGDIRIRGGFSAIHASFSNLAMQPYVDGPIIHNNNVLIQPLYLGAISGGSVVQGNGGFNKGNVVDLDTASGQITTSNGALAGNTTVSFLLRSDKITANSNVIVNRLSGGTNDAYQVWTDTVTPGQARICIRNTTGGSLSESLVLQFNVLRGSATAA